jgi:cyclic lactone autoinducer peptide
VPKFDELFVLRLDSSNRPRGARFANLTDKVASSAIDMKCRVLIHQPKAVSELGMKLPAGRMLGSKLVMPRIQRELYDKISQAAHVAAKRETARMEIGAAKQSAYIKQLIQQAQAALAEAREQKNA